MSEPQGPNIVDLAESLDPRIVGGKAVNLARMIQAGLPVPGGFVVTTAAHARARQAGAEGVPEELAEPIREAYRRLGSPRVAARSSATAEDLAEASMAGQYETFLDVADEDGLLAAVARCWASLRSDRVRTYLAGHGIDPAAVGMAVVVQRLVAADVAGVLFTSNPHAGRRGEMLIEAAWGLGEAVVSGRVQPDVVRLDRETGETVDVYVADKRTSVDPETGREIPVANERREKACLGSAEMAKLHDLGLRVEEHFGSPQDIEWAIAGGEVFLLQSRPITTLEQVEAYEAVIGEARASLESLLEAGRGPWVIHNISETLPHPTPLTWSVIRRFMSGSGGFGQMYRMAGFEPSPRVEREGFLRQILGRPYMDAALAPEMFCEDFPFAYDLEELRSRPDASQSPPTVPTGGLRARLRAGRKVAEANRTLHDLAEDFDHRLDDDIVPAFVGWVRSEKERDLADLSAEAWVELWEERERRILDEFGPRAFLPSLIGAMAMADLRTTLAENFWDQDPDELIDAIAVSPVPDKTVEQNAGLYELAHGRLALETWLESYGHRGPQEFDLSAPRWREQTDELRAMADRLKTGRDPMAMHKERQAEAEAKVMDLRKRLRGPERAEFDSRLALLRRYIRFREDGKYYLMFGYDLLRDLALDGGRRLGIGDDVFLLTLEELKSSLAQGAVPADALEARRVGRRAQDQASLPHTIDAEAIETLGEPRPPATGDHLSAFPVSHGTATGPVRIVHAPGKAGELGRDYVLVCPSTDPAWTPLFVGAAGLVLEQGGTLSHGAIVAREMGIPAVVLPDATKVLTEGEEITLDGHHGAVLRAGAEVETPEAAGAADPADTRIDPTRLPPVPGRGERIAARVRNVSLLAWGAVLLVVLLSWGNVLPGEWVWEPCVRAVDRLLWPLIASLGRPATVLIVAAVFAVATMVGQRLLTDHARLREAKRRSNELTKEAAELPAESPRRKAIGTLTAQVQARLVAAAFVPLAVLLGPMIVVFLWLGERMISTGWNARPGTTVKVVATVDGEFGDPFALEVEEPLALGETSESVRRLPPIREVLESHAEALTQAAGQSELPERILDAAEKAAKRQPLREFLDAEVPPQGVTWQVTSDEGAAGRFDVAVRASDAPPLKLQVVLGQDHPPGRTLVKGPKDSPLRSLKVIYPKPDPPRILWSPLKWAGNWAWLVLYLLAYVPAMFGLRWLLGIP